MGRGRPEAGPADRTAPNGHDPGSAAVPEKPTAEDGPAKPTDFDKASWWAAGKRTVKQAGNDKITTWAAALTYYAILSIFPGLLVLISVLRLSGQSMTQKVLDNLTALAPGPARTVLTTAIQNLQQGQESTAGLVAIVGVATALWSASGYIGAFMDAANSIFDVPEGRPAWKKLPIRLGITVLAGTLVAAAALAVVLTGNLAERLGRLVGLGSGFVQAWNILKWPVLVILVGLLLAVLYWAAPNAKQQGFRWTTPGSMLAVVIWVAASAGFAIYVTNFSSYNKVYGSLAVVIIFLIWLWITNIAVLLGAEFDAELQRGRAIEAGHDPDREPYLELRDTSKLKDAPNDL